MPRIAWLTRDAISLLTDEWRDVEDLLLALIPKVAPGQALRRYEAVREAESRRKPPVTDMRKPPLTRDQKIRSGARSVVRDSLKALRQGGFGEFRRVDDVEQVRRGPVPIEMLGRPRQSRPRKPVAKSAPRGAGREPEERPPPDPTFLLVGAIKHVMEVRNPQDFILAQVTAGSALKAYQLLTGAVEEPVADEAVPAPPLEGERVR